MQNIIWRYNFLIFVIILNINSFHNFYIKFFLMFTFYKVSFLNIPYKYNDIWMNSLQYEHKPYITILCLYKQQLLCIFNISFAFFIYIKNVYHKNENSQKLFFIFIFCNFLSYLRFLTEYFNIFICSFINISIFSWVIYSMQIFHICSNSFLIWILNFSGKILCIKFF